MASKYAEIVIRVYDSIRSKIPSKINHNARLKLNSSKTKITICMSRLLSRCAVSHTETRKANSNLLKVNKHTKQKLLAVAVPLKSCTDDAEYS